MEILTTAPKADKPTLPGTRRNMCSLMEHSERSYREEIARQEAEQETADNPKTTTAN